MKITQVLVYLFSLLTVVPIVLYLFGWSSYFLRPTETSWKYCVDRAFDGPRKLEGRDMWLNYIHVEDSRDLVKVPWV